jgi:ribose transport system substrate-binding protein
LRTTFLRALLALACALSALPAFAAGPPYIPMIAKGSQQEYWQAVMRGAQRAARDYNVIVTLEGPENETMVDQQVEMLSAALAKNPSALCIAALDSAAVAPLLQKAKAAKIPVIGFDSGADSVIPVTTAATDNAAAAALAADKMSALVGGAGTVGIIAPDTTSRTAIDRRDGFLRAMRKWHTRVQIIAPQYSGGDAARAAEIAKAMIQEHPDIRGIVAGDEGSAEGVVKAVQELDLAGRIVVIGYDSGKVQVEAIRGGLMSGAVTQDPFRIGYLAVEAAVRAIAGRRVSKTIDTGFHWYDRTNIDDPAIEAILFQ